MALMMIFSNETQNKYQEKALRMGLDYYQTDNIYQFLRYAKEAKPDIVLMRFEKNFNSNSAIISEVKKALCENDICPQIYLNKPDDFEGEDFFENIDFESDTDVFSNVESKEILRKNQIN